MAAVTACDSMNTSSIINFIVLSFSLLGTALGQGTFQFQNYDGPLGINAPVFDAQGVALSGNAYLAELYGGIVSNSLSPAMPRTAVPFFTGIGAGYFQAPHAVFFEDVPGGSFAWLQVRAWDARLGATYENVVALSLGGYGSSPVFYAVSGNPGALVPPAPLIGLQSFSLLPVVPEPSAWTLLALGGAVLLWALRRQSQSRL